MKATRFISLMALILSLLSLQGMALAPESNKKPVKADLEFYPNYAGHLLGVARIGYSSNYADKYQFSVNPIDLQYLKKHADLLEWSEGDEGILSYFFLTFPGYVNPASKNQLNEYLTDLNSAVAQKSFVQFKEKYKYYINELELWSGFNENKLIFNYSEEIQSLSKILMNNYDTYRQDVWPEQEAFMVRIANALNEKFDEWDLIRKWEKITGLEYLAPYYRVVLSNGIENGLSGKTLGYEKQWYFAGGDPKELIKSICQETGFRVLAGLCSQKYANYNPNICFEVYQTLAEYFTDQIFADLGLGDQLKTASSSSELYSIFDILSGMNPHLEVDQLYSIALDTYSRTKYAISVE